MLALTLTIGATAAAPIRSLPAAWVAFNVAWEGISGYDCRVTIIEQKNSVTQQETFDYTFRKPSTATMHVIAGPNKGVTLVWNGGATVVAHRGSGLSALFKKSFPLHDPQITTIRGSSIDQLSFGAILTHAHDTEGLIAEGNGPIVDGVPTDEVTLIPTNAVINTGLTLEVVDLAKATHLPVRLLGYEGHVLVRTIFFSNVSLAP